MKKLIGFGGKFALGVVFLSGGLLAQVNASASGSLVDENGVTADTITVTEIEYTGQCPGTDVDAPVLRFASDTTSPQDYYRVNLWTEADSSGAALPGTVYRKYNEGDSSENLQVRIANESTKKVLAVSEGLNTIGYQIFDKRDDGQAKESGLFDLNVSYERIDGGPRSRSCRWESSCSEFICYPIRVCDCF